MAESVTPEPTEAAFADQVVELARILGWRVAHFRPARTAHGWRTPVQGDGAGFPDLVLVRERVVFAELKSRRGTVRAGQAEWLGWIVAAGVEAYVWRPADWDALVEVLRRRRPAKNAA